MPALNRLPSSARHPSTFVATVELCDDKKKRVAYTGLPPANKPLKLDDGREVCGGMTRDKYGGQRWCCLKTILMANGRCDTHGGKSTGPARVGGRFSKIIPKGWQEGYENALNNPELASLFDSVSLIRGWQEDTVRKLQTGGTADQWIRARELADEVRLTKSTDALTELLQLLEAVEPDPVAEERLLSLFEMERKQQEALHKQEERSSRSITERQMGATLGVLWSTLQSGVERMLNSMMLLELPEESRQQLITEVGKLLPWVGHEFARQFRQPVIQSAD